MPARCLAVWLTVFCAAAAAQVRTPSTVQAARTRVALEHARVDQSSSILVPSSVASSDTVRILAVMVDFQTSPNNYTTGNGHFQFDTSSTHHLIDPPPHDSAYFAYKLQFLANYFRRVSNGKVNIKGDVFGRLITLSKTMAQYSPAKDGSNNVPLGNLIVDAWHTADSLYPTLQFSKYDAFLIFHAGVGRDVDLVASLGYDPTPFDLPTITFSLRTLRNFLGDQSYAGVPVSKGSFRITNTMLLPETETRVITSGSVVDTIQASTNGLLANSFGSFLGLPDLFNTATGAPGIGQFGLMDPVGGFGFYNGLFPPEPSAWEKIYLGWVTPVTVGAGTTLISLPAVGLKTGRDTVYKVPISDREYFLIENRMRDPKQDGLHLTIRYGGSIVTRFFPRDTTGFNFQDVSLINGSVVDVEDFDWALPSLTSIQDSDYVGGGILIWHIDENVIAQGLATNTVNADPSHRGVDLEEADGSQDIGRSYDPFTEVGAGTEWGYEQDFWYSGNPISVYTNVFDKNSQPNSRSYSGAMSLVTVRNFSQRAPRMSAIVDVGDSDVKRLQGFARTIVGNSLVSPPSANGSTVLLGANGGIYAFRGDGSSKTKDTSGLLFSKGGGTAVASTALGSNLLVAGVQDSTLIILNTFAKSTDAVIDSVSSIVVPTGSRLTTPAMFADLSITPSIVVGSAHGSVLSYSYLGALLKKTVVSSSPINSLTQLPTPSLSNPAELFFTCGGSLYSAQSSIALGDSSFPWIAAGVVNRSGNYIVVAQRGGNKVMAFSRDLSQKLFEITTSGSGIISVAAADIEGVGEKDVILLASDRLAVLNRTGAYVSGFPVSPSSGWSFVGDPLIGDVNGDGRMEILVSINSGNIAAYDNNGRLLIGFPIQLASTGVTPVAFFQTAAGNIGIVGLTGPSSIIGVTPVTFSQTTAGSISIGGLTGPSSIQGVPLGSGSSTTVTSTIGASILQALELTKPYRSDFIAWSQYLKDGRHSNYDATAGGTNPVSGDFLPHARVYNWPNPVYGSTTQIRYYTPEDAAISIKILDLAGTKITELNTTSRGGLDGEITWDVSKVQSGVYLARIEAKGASRSDVATIKIAVVK